MDRTYGDKLNPYRQPKVQNALRAKHLHHRISHNPSSAKPNETLYVRLPKLHENILFVPGSIYLTCDIVLSGHDNNYLVNNVSRALIRKFVVKIGGEIVFDLNNYNMFMTYKDLWMNKNQRQNMIYQGIGGTNIRKLRSDAKDAVKTNVNENTLKDTYGTRYMIPLDIEILTCHSPLYNYALYSDIILEITLADKKDVILSSNVEGWGYTLSNICLEYDTIENEMLSRSVEQIYQSGYVFLYDFIQHFKTINVDDTIINENINLPKKSLKGVLFLFRAAYNDGAIDNEEFQNPKINDISITIEGISNQIYAQHVKPCDFWVEAKKYFYSEDMKVDNISDVDVSTYYGSKFGLWLDFRTIDTHQLHNSGLRLNNSKDGIAISMKRENKRVYECHIFVVSDSQISIQNKQIISFQQ